MKYKEKLIWAAGFIDGEGCLRIRKDKDRNAKHGYVYTVSVSVEQVDLRPLKILSKLFGGNININNKRLIGRWAINGKEAIKAIKKIKYFLIEKREEADLLIKYEKTYNYKGRIISDNIRKIRNNLYIKCKNIKLSRFSRVDYLNEKKPQI